MSPYNEAGIGWKGTGATAQTSKAGADLVAATAPRMEDRCEGYIRAHGPSSPEEVAAGIAMPGERLLLTSVRARICGLRAKGRVVATDERGLGESGKVKVIKWRCATPEELSLHLARKAAEDEKGPNHAG